MKQNTASRTAQYMALFRGLEDARPPHRRLFADPYATMFLDAKLRTAVRMSAVPWVRDLIIRTIESKGPGALSSAIARTGYIDDLLASTIDSGVRQVIILGAGFDTRAWRMPALNKVKVIEVDHPDTAAFKRRRLEKLNGLRSNVTLITIDFNRQDLHQVIRENRIDLSMQTTVVWEGVSNYISAEGVRRSFDFVSSLVSGSHLIFTYVDRLVLDNPSAFFGTGQVMETLRKNNEQWTFGFDPAQLRNYLNDFGLKLIEDRSAAQYRKEYIPERANISRGYEFYHVAMAVREGN